MKHVITPEEMKKTYKECLKREARRYRKWAKTKQGRFETHDILHFDAEDEEAKEREHSSSWLSDRGKGAWAIRRCSPAREEILRRKEAAAIEKVRRYDPRLLDVFRLILKNGSNREKSICELMKIHTPKK